MNTIIAAQLERMSRARAAIDAAQAATQAAHAAAAARADEAARAVAAADEAVRAADAAERAEVDAIDAAQAEIAAAEAAIAAANAPPPAPPAPAPAPEPTPSPPSPAPAPEPSPPPAPPSAVPAITSEPLIATRIIAFSTQHGESRYERYQRTHVITGPTSLAIALWDLASGGVIKPLPGGDYVLMVDGAEHSRITVTAGAVSAGFPVSPATLAAGWRRVQVLDPTGALSPSWFVHVGTERVDDVVPVCTGSYEWANGSRHRWCWVRHDAAPAPKPLAPRARPHFSTALPGASLYLEALVPPTTTTRITALGEVRSTFGKQAYFWQDLVRKLPQLPLLDGPRGVGTLYMPTHIEVGRATQTADPASAPVGALYVLDPWRLMRVNADGAIRTLVGWRHRSPPANWLARPDLELVGDWSAVPPERHGLHEAWGMAWDRRSLAVDTTAPVDPDGRQRHVGGPAAYITDSQHNRVLKAVFDGGSHTTPAKVTEFLTGLADPWDCVEHGAELIVSERGAHRICAYSMDTGELLRVLVQGEALATVDVNRFVRRTAGAEALAKRRAAPCVAPEGLARLGDWLYFGSIAQEQTRRVNLVTGELQVVAPFPVDLNSQFAKIAVSDGTFGPAGSVFVSTWGTTFGGWPTAALPDGKWWDYRTDAGSAGPKSGRGPNWGTFNYGTAVGIGGGRMVFGGSQYGLYQVTQALPGDPTVDAARYTKGSYSLIRGLYADGGYSAHGLPVPWGVTAELDYYLRTHGHVPA
jgi:hypothetical protein